jgi:hypothetical protein
VGIAPQATIIGVKALHGGWGAFGQAIAGLLILICQFSIDSRSTVR